MAKTGITASARFRPDEAWFFRVLMENSTDAIYFKDRNSRFVSINRKFAERFGKNDPSECLGLSDFDFFSREHAQQAYDDEQRIIRTRKSIIDKEERETIEGRSDAWASTSKMPLRDPDGNIVGIFGVSRDVTQRKLTQDRLRAQNKAMQDDLAMARGVQQALLARQCSRFPARSKPGQFSFSFDHRYIPAARLAGDFFNIFPFSKSEVGIMICDVMGHGARAALMAAYLRGLMEEIIHLEKDPGKIMGRMNAGIISAMKNYDHAMFATACLVILDTKTGAVRSVNAGHPPPIIVRRKKKIVELLRRTATRTREPGLGLVEGAEYSVHRNNIGEDDLIFMFTDGVYEVRNKKRELFGRPRFTELIRKNMALAPEALVEFLLREIRDHTQSGEMDDDLCMITAHATRPGKA